ncbi:fatty acyl-AMP ligase [Pseudomonas fulva]|uniref:AMP-binding protein n=1 Tax=Pseudomonas fulva TaxID=47880 RepID=UPI001428C80E|nr:AMP-binding protein [Pseudomonas fulva]NIX94373.1 fatty acyl-AMP ligase [Pseudomonas fulva]
MERTIADILSWRAEEHGRDIAFQFVRTEDDALQTVTYRQLHMRALSVAQTLLQRLQPGDRVLMLYPAGLEFISAFFGCLYAGIIPAPAYPPRKNQNFARLDGIVRDAGAAAVLTVASVSEQAHQMFKGDAHLSHTPWFNTDEIEWEATPLCDMPILPTIGVEETAFIQYTSGSTGEPKVAGFSK